MHHNRSGLAIPEFVEVHWASARVHFGVGNHFLVVGETVGEADMGSDSAAAIVTVGSGCLARSDLARVSLSVEDSSAEAR